MFNIEDSGSLLIIAVLQHNYPLHGAIILVDWYQVIFVKLCRNVPRRIGAVLKAKVGHTIH